MVSNELGQQRGPNNMALLAMMVYSWPEETAKVGSRAYGADSRIAVELVPEPMGLIPGSVELVPTSTHSYVLLHT